jgi:hypothetical protein
VYRHTNAVDESVHHSVAQNYNNVYRNNGNSDDVNLMLSVKYTNTFTTQTPLPSRQQVEHPSSMLSVPLCPATVAVISKIQQQSSSKPLTALIDTGST